MALHLQSTCTELFFMVLGFELRALHLASALLLEPHLQPILFWLFWRWGSRETICPGWPQIMILQNSAKLPSS
jgi:hypothetical protein